MPNYGRFRSGRGEAFEKIQHSFMLQKPPPTEYRHRQLKTFANKLLPETESKHHIQ